MNQSSTSDLIGTFWRTQIDYHWHDGEVVIVAQIVRRDGNKFVVRSKEHREYTVESSALLNIVPVTQHPLYNIGDIVNAVVNYHWHDGEFTDYCKILAVSTFCNDVDYTIMVLKGEKFLTVTQEKIRGRAALQKAKYAVGHRVGVKHSNGHPYYYDEYIKNGIIMYVNSWYDKVTYSVSYDDGTSDARICEDSITAPSVVKTVAQREQENAVYLQAEEQRLLQQLDNVRKK
jgi:hypothetical protein